MSKIILPVALSLLVSNALMAESFSIVEYVNVTRSAPIYSTIQEEIPSERCYDVKEEVSSASGGHSDVVGAVVGGALGGVLGHQVGGGKGKTAATVGGAVLGTLAGQNVGSKYNTPQNATYRVVRKCEVTNTVQSRQVLSGYNNIAKVKGKEISVESDQPLKRIPVTVTYSY